MDVVRSLWCVYIYLSLSLYIYLLLLIIANCCPSILTSKRKESSTNNRDCFNGDSLASPYSKVRTGITDVVNNVANKARRTLGFWWHNLKISSSAIKDRACKAFITPILEYASSVGDPYKIHPEEHWQVVGCPETSCPIHAEPIPQHF